MTAPYLEAHAAAERVGVTTNQLAHWARRGWITRHEVGKATFYSSAEIDALIASGRTGLARPSNVTSLSEALAEANTYFGIGQTAASPSRRRTNRAPSRGAIAGTTRSEGRRA